RGHRNERQQRARASDRGFDVQPLGLDRALDVGVEVEVRRGPALAHADGGEAARLARSVEVAGAVGEVQLDGPHALDLAYFTGECEAAALTRVPALLLRVGDVRLPGDAAGLSTRLRPVLVRGRHEIDQAGNRHLRGRRLRVARRSQQP